MSAFAVEYTYDTNRTDDLAAVRPTHREFLQGLLDEGSLLASGPWLDNAAPGALLLVVAPDVEGAQRLLDDDPFLKAHLITQRTVRPWNPIMGPFAEHASQ
ncbi:YciI family protein [Georgenia satyanarayanai]|uniref:YciI family protein n=1 Tax=Georgenia satyanarayanai TaxID=860221 RepID=UPI00203F608C|nr:YciI family protein [Georgenia satyanarayanai]MCM3659945.1 YciI family protein [Georgenia satyanarayanai]